MSRIRSYLFLFVLCTAVIYTGCKKDEEEGLIGTYSHTFQDETESYLVELQFTDDGHLIWTPVDSIPGATVSTVKYETIAEDQFRIYDDPECGNDGTYSYTADENGLDLAVINDECDDRKESLTGHWDRK